MPQMWPMAWEILFIITLIILLAIITKMTFILKTNTMNKNLNNSQVNTNNPMKW